MDDEEYESFDINDRDYENAVDPSKRRRRGQTKEQQLYGIWAESEDEEPPRGGFGGSNYSDPTKGVSFVSAGTSGSSVQPGPSTSPPSEKRTKYASGSRTESFNSGNGAQIFAGMRSSTVHGFSNTGGSDWTSTSGKSSVIMSMMKKMGYEPGKGLGANKQGIVEPIRAAPRQGKGAVGAYGPESSAIGQKFGETAAEAQARQRDGTTENTGKPVAPPPGNWKKGRKQAVKLKSLADVLAQNNPNDPDVTIISGQKIIDMTGPEQRVYNDFQTLSKIKSVTISRKFDIPELVLNTTHQLDATSREIIRNERHCKTLRENNRNMRNDNNVVKQRLIQDKEEMLRLCDVIDVLTQFKAQGETTLDNLKALILKLRRKFPVEYRLYKLETVVLATVVPFFKNYLANWNPLDSKQVEYGFDILNEWKGVFDGERGEKKDTFDRVKNELETLPAFDRCLWEAWMPQMRSAALIWNVRNNSAAMLHVIASWMPLLPDWLSANLLEQVIMPRITTFVDQWNPLTDSVPIHSWLLPWQDLLGHRLMPVYAPIRQKLAKALREWNPTDDSAYAVLLPWKNVFTPATMSSFLSMNIVPKLENALMNMSMIPNGNPYLEFFALIKWIDMIGISITSQILLKTFFPRWLENLVFWLTSPGVNLSEVAYYYKEWRDRFPPALAELPLIKSEFGRALGVIGQRKKNEPISLAPSQQSMPSAQPPKQGHFFNHPRPPPTTNVRELLEHQAHISGIVFMPLRNRSEQGKPVYQLGSLLVYFDRDVLLALHPVSKRWLPMGITEALDFAAST